MTALTEWARADLLCAYEVLALAIHWQKQTIWDAVCGGASCHAGERRATELTPEELPAGVVLDATYEEEAQFDPQTLEAAFGQAGFAAVELRVGISFDTPHIFAVFGRL